MTSRILSAAKIALLLALPFTPTIAGVPYSYPISSSFHPVCSPASNRRPVALLEQRASHPSSPKDLRVRSRGWEWGRLSVPRWKWLQTDHIYIRSDARLKEMRKVGVYVETFLQEFRKGLGKPELTLHLFGSQNSFSRYSFFRGQRAEVPFFDPDYMEVVGFVPSEGKRDQVLGQIRRAIRELYY